MVLGVGSATFGLDEHQIYHGDGGRPAALACSAVPIFKASSGFLPASESWVSAARHLTVSRNSSGYTPRQFQGNQVSFHKMRKIHHPWGERNLPNATIVSLVCFEDPHCLLVAKHRHCLVKVLSQIHGQSFLTDWLIRSQRLTVRTRSVWWCHPSLWYLNCRSIIGCWEHPMLADILTIGMEEKSDWNRFFSEIPTHPPRSSKNCLSVMGPGWRSHVTSTSNGFLVLLIVRPWIPVAQLSHGATRHFEHVFMINSPEFLEIRYHCSPELDKLLNKNHVERCIL